MAASLLPRILGALLAAVMFALLKIRAVLRRPRSSDDATHACGRAPSLHRHGRAGHVTRSPRRAARRPGAPGTPSRSRGVRHGERLIRAPRARGELHARRHARRHRPQGEGSPATPASAQPLERCRACGADFVLPVEWTEAGTHHWWMRLRCAACDDAREVTVGDAAAEEFDVALDRGLHAIRKALEIAERERMTADVDTMIAALRRDLVDASDFAR